MHSIPYVLLSSIPMFVCGFWTLTFLGQYKHVHVSKKIFFWFMLTATLLYFGHFVVFNHLFHFIPITDTIYTFATLSVYPIFYLYILALTGKISRKDLWILLPGISIAVVIGICYLLIPKALMHDFLLTCHYDKELSMNHGAINVSLYAHLLMKPVILIEVILVLFYGFRRLHIFRNRIKQSFSNLEQKGLGEVEFLLITLIVTSGLSSVADIIGRAYFIGTCLLVSLPTISFGIVLFIIGHIVDHQHFTIDDIESEEELSSDPFKGKETQEKETRYKLRQSMDLLMEQQQLFLRADLKMSDLARILNTNRTYIYEALTLNQGSAESISFSNYINQYRILYCIKLLESMPDVKIETLAYESGFLSKASFYKNFKKFAGKTPTAYIKEHKRG